MFRLVTLTGSVLAVGCVMGLGAAGAVDTPCPASKVSTDRVNAGTMGTHEAAGMDIVDTAAKTGSFKTLLAAAKAAGLVDALKSDGPLTVFAPTDEAFAALPKGTVESLLKEENRATLQAILTYHVIPGEISSRDVARASGATALNGQRLSYKYDGSEVWVDNARVVMPDIACSNGIIHVIDRVMLPTSDNLVTLASNAGTFQTLIAAAKAAGLADALMGDQPLTVFAPTDDAFAKLPAGTVEALLKPENREALINILKYHIVSGRVYAADAVRAGSAPTLEGNSVLIDIRNGRLTVDGADIVATDIDASNGVVHIIDRVILPPNG